MQSLVETGPVVLEKKIYEFRQCILLRSPLMKRRGPSFESPLSKDALCQVSSSGSEEEEF